MRQSRSEAEWVREELARAKVLLAYPLGHDALVLRDAEVIIRLATGWLSLAEQVADTEGIHVDVV